MKNVILASFDLVNKSQVIFELTKNDFKNKYLGSYLGIIWPFINPVITISIFTFIFQFGFRSAPVDNVPFVVWLCAGLIPWFYIAETFFAGANSFIEYSFLIKKVSFRVSFIPLIKLFSNLIIHFTFIVLLILLLITHGYYPNIYWLQYFYYLLCMLFLLTGLSWLSSSIMVFIKDVGNVINILTQFGFWLTPIVWNIEFLPQKYLWFIRLNPVLYIVQGFRNTFIYNKWFWEDAFLFCYFWAATFALIGLGLFVFKKTKPHFGDVL